MTTTRFLILLTCSALLGGCMSSRISPGKTTTAISPAGEVTAAAVQSQDPQGPTTQTIESDLATSLLTPNTDTNLPDAPPVVISKTETHKKITTTIGASQKNTAAEIAAKLASVRWLQWAGLLIVLFGVGTLAYPPLRLIVNSVTTSAWLIGAGAAMIVLPLLVVGHEVLIISIACGVAGLWFLAHRHGSLAGELAALKSDFTPMPAAPVPAAPLTPANALATNTALVKNL